MFYAPVTAFLRPVDSVQLQRAQAAVASRAQAETAAGVNKWELLRDLIAARAAYGLGDRDLAVLEALLSFHPGVQLGGDAGAPVVHPSNQAICERLKGMPCSTMRRHLARLVDSGLIARRDSPNGKRYVRRSAGQKLAFGFDLSPLIARQPEISAAAETQRAEADRLARLRETVSLMRRDLAGLSGYGRSLRPDLALWDRFADLAVLSARALRRKLDGLALERLAETLSQALDQARDMLDLHLNAEETSTNACQNEQHHQNSKTESYDIESCAEEQEVTAYDRDLPNIPLSLVLTICHEIHVYAPEPIRHWHHLVQAADALCPMMGISRPVWNEAKAAMGPEQAAVVVAAILERFAEIRAPAGYLRSLTRKAEAGGFSCGPMIMALMRKAS